MLSFNFASKAIGAAAISAGLLAAPAAHAEWHRGWGGGGGWHHSEFRPRYRPGIGIGPVIAGGVLGLGAAALIAGALAPPPPPVYYAPRAYYAPPVVYAPPPAYAYAPPAYYAPPPPAYYVPGYGY